jgi:hypothetical protein
MQKIPSKLHPRIDISPLQGRNSTPRTEFVGTPHSDLVSRNIHAHPLSSQQPQSKPTQPSHSNNIRVNLWADFKGPATLAWHTNDSSGSELTQSLPIHNTSLTPIYPPPLLSQCRKHNNKLRSHPFEKNYKLKISKRLGFRTIVSSRQPGRPQD